MPPESLDELLLPAAPFRSATSPTSGAFSARNAKTSSSVTGSSPSSLRECPRTSVLSGLPKTSSSTSSTPWASAASTAWMVFGGARAAAPRWPILSTGPSPRKRFKAPSAAGCPPAAAPGGVLEDHAVGDPLDRRMIIGPGIVGRLRDLHVPREEVRDRPQASR